jgi:hypothetical protein
MKELQKQMNHCIQTIREILQSKKENEKPILSHFLHMLEMKARLERLGASVNIFAYQSCCKDLKEYHQMLLDMYERSFGFHLPEKVIECAKNIDKHLELLAPDAENNEFQEETKDEIVEQCFHLLVERDTLALIQSEMAGLFPDHDFEEATSYLGHMDDAFRDIYFPHEVAAKVKEYAQSNHVDTQKTPWFCRPTIEESPLILECELDDVETEVMLEEINKNPVPVPEKLRNRRLSVGAKKSKEKSKIIVFSMVEQLAEAVRFRPRLAAAATETEAPVSCYIWRDDTETWEARIYLENSADSADDQPIYWRLSNSRQQKVPWQEMCLQLGSLAMAISPEGCAFCRRIQMQQMQEQGVVDCTLSCHSDGSSIALHFRGKRDG